MTRVGTWIVRYIQEVLQLDSRDSFFEELRKMSYINWNTAYTAAAINSWIKEGFSVISATQNEFDKSSAHLFPNPGGSTINISQMRGSNSMTVYDYNGKKVAQFITQSKTHLNLPDLPKGLYLLRFFDNHEVLTASVKYAKLN